MLASQVTTKTVVEIDLVAYTDIARVLEEHLDVHAVKALQDQIQSFVDEGLTLLGLCRNEVVFGTADDNALLFFDDAPTAHRFSEAVHRFCAEYNRHKEVESAQRWFRIGAATGVVLILADERRIVGTTVCRAVRLEAAAHRGQLVVDTPTFNALPDDLRSRYGTEELVCGKRAERYAARRCTFIEQTAEPV
jgi:class 3 adenylate cyclase